MSFDWEPTSPPEAIAAEPSAGDPSIEIVSPEDGETVSGSFDLEVEVENFELSSDLFGKQPVEGYGHWYVFLDEAKGLSTMLGMVAGDSMPVSLEGIEPGEHTFIATLANNLHAPLDSPVSDSVTVTVE